MYALYDTEEKAWVSDDLGPVKFEDKHLAEISMKILPIKDRLEVRKFED